MRETLSGTQALQFAALPHDAQRYRWIEGVLRRIRYRTLRRASHGIVLAYLQRFSGHRRAQVTRLVSSRAGRQALVRPDRAPAHAFAQRYTAADVPLLSEVDRTLETLSGPATACVLRRQRDVFGKTGANRETDL